MRHLRLMITLTLFSIALFVATNPVFAAAGGNGNGNNGNGNGNGGSKGGDAGSGALPEAPMAVLLPLVGLAVVGIVLMIVYTRRRDRQMVTE